MARRKKTNKTITEIFIAIVFIILAILGTDKLQETVSTAKIEENSVSKIEIDEQKLEVIFFDVGQAESILILNDGKSMLIDAGNDENGEQIVANIKALGVSKLDYAVITHMHADHMGGMDKVINELDIGNIYMPESLQTTKQMEELLEAMQEKNLTYESPNIGDSFTVGNANGKIVYINSEETENLNNSSIVLEITFGTQKFLFTGDAEKKVEEILQLDKVNVLKVAHHGSSTSSSEKFIKQIKPEIAVISVGKDNSYNHPNDAVIKRLEQIGATIYRTDKLGTIWISCDGITNIVNKMGE